MRLPGTTAGGGAARHFKGALIAQPVGGSNRPHRRRKAAI